MHCTAVKAGSVIGSVLLLHFGMRCLRFNAMNLGADCCFSEHTVYCVLYCYPMQDSLVFRWAPEVGQLDIPQSAKIQRMRTNYLKSTLRRKRNQESKAKMEGCTVETEFSSPICSSCGSRLQFDRACM